MSVLESILGTDAIYNDTVEVVGDDVPETNVDDRETNQNDNYDPSLEYEDSFKREDYNDDGDAEAKGEDPENEDFPNRSPAPNDYEEDHKSQRDNMKENDDIKEEKDKEPTKRSHDREIKKGDNQDEKRSKKGDGYWPSQRCKIPFDVRDMSYEEYVEKHYEVMRTKMWNNYTANAGVGGGMGPAGGVGAPPAIPPQMMGPGPMMPVMSGPNPYFTPPGHMMYPMGPSMSGMMQDPSFYRMNEGRGSYGFRGRGRGPYRGGRF